MDVLDGGTGTDTLIFDFSSSVRHSDAGVARDVTISNLSVFTGESGILGPDVQTSMVGIEGVVLRFGENLGGVVVDTNDDSADASAFSGSEGVQFISGGGADVFTGSSGDDIFSFLLGGGTATQASIDGGSGDDALVVRIVTGGNQSISFAGDEISTLDGESIGFTGIERIAFMADGLSSGGGGTTTVDLSSTPQDVWFDFTNGASVTDYAGSLLLTSGSGNDVVVSNAGDDEISAGAGDDTIDAGAGDDVVDGGSGNDVIDGGSGNDVIDGNEGFDFASYFSADSGIQVTLATPGVPQDTIGAGTDTLVSIEGLIGSSFADVLTGNAGDNRIEGRFGDDTLVGGDGDDGLNGQGGSDTASYYNATSAVTVTLQGLGVAQNTFGAGVDTLTSIENLVGSDFADRLTGSGTSNAIEGRDGNDYISGLYGADRLYGGTGNDELIGGYGFDRLEGGAGNDSLTGNNGDDVILGGTGDDLIHGNYGGDTILGGGDNDTIFGGFGLDTIYGDGGDDIISGGAGADELQGGTGGDILSGDAGADLLLGGIGFDTLHGGGAGDDIHGGRGNDQQWGDGGDDVLHGNDGADVLDGGSGDDEIIGGVGADTITGGIGADILSGSAGADHISGGGDADNIRGDGGADTLVGDGGDDIIAGNFGRDSITGGFGADTFVWENQFESGRLAVGADIVTDFSQAQGDLIDISAIDADTNADGNQAFGFAGTAAFGGNAGELRYYFDGSGDTIVEMDVDGDATSDMAIRLTGEIALDASDFVGVDAVAAAMEAGGAKAGTTSLPATLFEPVVDMAPASVDLLF